MNIKRLIEPIEETSFSPVDDTSFVVDVDSVNEIVEKLNEVIGYINNKEREKK